jgi:predicted Zn-dependent protease
VSSPWTREGAADLLRRALKAAGRTEAEASLGGGRLALTRFANNIIHQNVVEEWPQLSLRVVLRGKDGARTARASTSRLDGAGLKALARDAKALAKVAAPRKDLLKPLAPAKHQPTEAWDPRTAEAGPALRADAASKIILPARRAGLTAAGVFATHRMSIGDYGDPGTYAMMASTGLFAYHRRTLVHCSCTVMADDSSGWADDHSHAFADVDPEALGARAIEKAERSRKPKGFEAGRTAVVLEPHAVASLLQFLLGAFSGQAVQEGRSPLAGRMGQSLFGPGVDLACDCFHPLHQGRPWDGEGVPTQRVQLIEDGTAKALVLSRSEALAEGGAAEPTGHGPSQPTTQGSSPRFPVLTVRGGEASLDDLLQEADNGVLVTRFWYNRSVDAKRVLVTGMTRDGTFRIRHGKTAEGIRNLRYNVSVIDVLNNVVAASKPVRAAGMVVPALLVRDFPFTSATRF